MKTLNYICTFVFILLVAVSCETDKDNLYSLDYIKAPTNVSAVFDITQDNTGLVTIAPNAEGAHKFLINYGDGSVEEEFKSGVNAKHTYTEGVYNVAIKAVGVTGKTTSVEQELNVTFKAPEDLKVTITKNEQNPAIVTVKATAKFATLFHVFFGDAEDEEPTTLMPEKEVTHTYAKAGDYDVRVIAKSAGAATTTFTETINIPDATDPVNMPVDFESFKINYAFTNFGNVTSSMVDNPDKNGMNISDKVAQSHKAAGAETWGGSFLTFENPMDFSVNKTLKVKVWSPKSGAVVRVKLEHLTDGGIFAELDATTTVANEWEELSYDFSSIDVNQQFHKLVIFFDFGNTGDDSKYYFDDLKLSPSVVPTESMVQNFEGEAPAFTVFGNIAGIEVIDNPDKTGSNQTDKVAKMVKTSGAETWAGMFFETGAPLDLDTYSKIKVKTWSPKSGVVVKLKLENADASITHEVDVNTTVADAWETLTYDFSGAPKADYVKVVLFFDFGNNGDDSVYYFDEIALANDDTSVPPLAIQGFEGEVPAFTVFGNIAGIEVIDNPDKAGDNTTNKVAKMVKTSGAETWAGMFFETGNALDFDNYKKVRVRTWSPKSGIVVKMKLENSDASITHEVDLNTSATNAWETLTYDFSDAPAAGYVRIVLFFDFGNGGDDAVYYFDEFELTN
ncbi:hypothetical protein EMN47_19770 [Prolixibacteraceae bacterium JC049]|nr:hypothetical protein [Prolixibacteraceae bacterium JC049]